VTPREPGCSYLGPLSERSAGRIAVYHGLWSEAEDYLPFARIRRQNHGISHVNSGNARKNCARIWGIGFAPFERSNKSTTLHGVSLFDADLQSGVIRVAVSESRSGAWCFLPLPLLPVRHTVLLLYSTKLTYRFGSPDKAMTERSSYDSVDDLERLVTEHAKELPDISHDVHTAHLRQAHRSRVRSTVGWFVLLVTVFGTGYLGGTWSTAGAHRDTPWVVGPLGAPYSNCMSDEEESQLETYI